MAEVINCAPQQISTELHYPSGEGWLQLGNEKIALHQLTRGQRAQILLAWRCTRATARFDDASEIAIQLLAFEKQREIELQRNISLIQRWLRRNHL